MAERFEIPEGVKKKLVGVESPPVPCPPIEKLAIQRFVEAIGDPNPRWQHEAPPTFPLGGEMGAEGEGPEISIPGLTFSTVLNGGNEWEYFQPVRSGDVLTAQRKIVELALRSGRMGPTLYAITQVTYKNQRGELVVISRNTGLRY